MPPEIRTYLCLYHPQFVDQLSCIVCWLFVTFHLHRHSKHHICIWTSLPSRRKFGVNPVFRFTLDLTLMPNGGKYVSHDHCWFPKIISSNPGPADCIAPPDHWNLANKESFWFNLLPAKRRKFWIFHCQNSSLDLCGPTMECQTAPHSLKICPGYWFSILYCQWHHLQPMSELIYNHENIFVALKNFTKGPMSRCAPGYPAWKFCSGACGFLDLLFTLHFRHVAM